MTPRPMNSLQRRYFAWASRFYDRMPPELAVEARKLDEYLYSRRGLGFWTGLGCAILGSTLGLTMAGFPWPLALVATVFVAGGLLVAGLSAWLQPDKALGGQAWRVVVKLSLGGFVGAMLGFLVGRAVRRGRGMFDDLVPALGDAALRAAPILVVVIVGTGLLMATVAALRRQQLRRELADMRLVAERDTAARQAAEARLRLLQAQIQPHFIFNTMASLQHWVDTADPRAGPLLRTLTTFLRGSTELLARDSARLSDEAAMVGHYLAILEARLGERLRYRIDIDPGCADLPVPPGLLLTLVENAVEHGIGPALHGGTVELEARRAAGRVEIAVRDDGAGLASGWHDGVGLANCRERLRHQHGERATLTLAARAPGTEARVTILDGAAA